MSIFMAGLCNVYAIIILTRYAFIRVTYFPELSFLCTRGRPLRENVFAYQPVVADPRYQRGSGKRRLANDIEDLCVLGNIRPLAF
jgi:hypothetical protein